MSEQTFEQMLEESLKKTIRSGDIVEGKVIEVKPDFLVIDIGQKADGILPKSEYSNDASIDLLEAVKPGDVMEVKILKVNDGEGQVSLTHKRIVADRGSKRLEQAFNDQEVLTAKVARVLPKGLTVVVDDINIFIPISLVSDVFEKDLTRYQDQEISFVMKDYDPKSRRYIGDRKQILEKKKKDLLAQIKEGDIIDGIVKNVTDFGAFVDLGGIDGLLHISEMSWSRIDNPKKHFNVGDTVKVMVKEIKGEKIALSAKFDDDNPWKDAESKYVVGNTVTGTIARMADFGAFVELEPGVDALLHVSQISKDHIEKPSDVLKKGEEITAKIVDFNKETQKISLSMKALLPDEPEDTEAAESAEEAPAEGGESDDNSGEE